ncbi:MAG: type I restriction enzyme HsdR N-terminal domain-containing protein [Bacteroidales bacterium]|nr:type I restriction enzyme HsdR N-terminal domain-containing protein [Bacteroidales bacterium]
MAPTQNTKTSQLFCLVRRRPVAHTPEEEVRQAVIRYLHESLHYPLELMSVECAITVATLTKRCDIVVYNRSTKPYIIVECKKPQVTINQKVVDQACRYNIALRVPYLYLTNGTHHLFLKADLDEQRLTQLPSLPDFLDM